jgi:hypothetical protein
MPTMFFQRVSNEVVLSFNGKPLLPFFGGVIKSNASSIVDVQGRIFLALLFFFNGHGGKHHPKA